MQLITSITNQPKQNFTLRLANNESAQMRMYFYPSQMSWYFDIEYKGKWNNGNKVVLTFNAIRHLQRQLPFGIGFLSVSKADPFNLETFTSGEFLMILLNQEDVILIEELVYNESSN